MNENIRPPKQFQVYNKPVLVQLKYQFTCDNRIYFSQKSYKDLYNHTYHLDVTLQDTVGNIGLAIDFFEVDRFFNDAIYQNVHQKRLNDVIHYNTTAENIAYWIYECFNQQYSDMLISLTLHETDTHAVTLTQAMMRL